MSLTDQLETKEPKEAPIDSTSNIVDINLEVSKKKKFRINGDNSKMLELDVTDIGIISRLKDAYPKLKKIEAEVRDILTSTDNVDVMGDEGAEKALQVYSDALEKCDNKMRSLVDELFGSNVSEVCASDGSMYKLHNGKFRYEHIIETLSNLYENNMNQEFAKLQARVQAKTSKYTGKH